MIFNQAFANMLYKYLNFNNTFFNEIDLIDLRFYY